MKALGLTFGNSLRLANRIHENFCSILCSLQIIFSDSQIPVCYVSVLKFYKMILLFDNL